MINEAFQTLTFRNAQKDDLINLVQLLADDKLGKYREDTTLPLNKKYLDAFTKIDKDINNQLIVIEKNNIIIGMLQLTFIPYLSEQGMLRCLIESVRITKSLRGNGYGTIVFKWAIKYAKSQNCDMVQLTSNKQRKGAINFYTKLGFDNSHAGLKLAIKD